MNKLRLYRQKRRLTQEELGVKSGVDRVTISQIENNKRSPSLRTMNKLSAALKAKTQKIFF